MNTKLLPFNINRLPCKLKLYTINGDRGGTHVTNNLPYPRRHFTSSPINSPSSLYGNQSCYESELFWGENVLKGNSVAVFLHFFTRRVHEVKHKRGELKGIMRSLVSLTTSIV